MREGIDFAQLRPDVCAELSGQGCHRRERSGRLFGGDPGSGSSGPPVRARFDANLGPRISESSRPSEAMSIAFSGVRGALRESRRVRSFSRRSWVPVDA